MSESPLRVDYHPFETGKPTRSGTKASRSLRALRYGIGALVLLVLPLVLLVRLSVFAYGRLQLSSWAALALGAGATFLLLVLYFWVARALISGTLTLPRAFLMGLLAVVGAYVCYALLYLSSANAKTPEIRRYYRSLDPLLRIGVSTVLLVDRGAVITDIERSAEDYARMGLPVNEASLHFPQSDGWAHAIDLRTRGRSEWRSRALHAYFWSMGFRTLRHVGTADHLHVSLPTRGER